MGSSDGHFGIAHDFQQLAREQIIFGCHVHVGIPDREAAIRVMNRTRPWLPALLALTCNSPFWLGIDTGYASYRTELFQRFPMVGTPNVLASRAEYDDLVAALVATGSVSDASKIYWDVRPSSHFETIEFRLAERLRRAEVFQYGRQSAAALRDRRWHAFEPKRR